VAAAVVPVLFDLPFASWQLDDMEWLREAIRTNKRRLTSVERYERELAGRRFEWTATHSADFWKENARAFEVDGFRLIEGIKGLLEAGDVDETTVAVALHDLGEFAVNHPNGRVVLASMGVKGAVMGMLRREEDEVRQQALLAVSKIMVSRWQFVSGAGSPAGGTPKPDAPVGAAGAGAGAKK